jgi:L-2-hydroxyglutarate oxidase LhgO
MESVDILIVGAGVVGLAIADRLAKPGREIALVEKNDGFGRETSSRNSELIHCGMYYGETLLKTRLCVKGNPMLYALCTRQGIPHRKTGKIVVATEEEEIGALHAILEQGKKNGVQGLELIGAEGIGKLEANASGILGLYSRESGILDVHRLMGYLEHSAKSKGVTVAYNSAVTGISRSQGGYTVEIAEPGGAALALGAGCVVNAAGLQSDRIAAMAGIEVDRHGYRLHPCKGEYFRISHRHRGKLGRPVYPIPSPVHLGAHAVLGLDGGLKLGPSSFYVNAMDYSVDPSNQREFHEKGRKFLPFLELEDLAPDMAGIRPKLYGPGEPFRDFIIREESDKGLPGFIDLVGIESPGLTSCLAIAEMAAGLL